MFESWGRVVYARRRLVLVLAAIVVVAAAVWGTRVFGALQSAGGFSAPGSQSQQQGDLAGRAFGRDAADVVVLYSSPRLTVRDPAFRVAVTRNLAVLPARDVRSAATYWSTRSPQFAGAGGHATYAVLELAGGTDSARAASYQAIKGRLFVPGISTQVGGQVPTMSAINKQVTSDIGRAEGISMPLLLILLLVIFGSLAAASLPLAIGGIGILGSFAALRLLTLVTDVSIYSINITTILGLGLAIDYGLFMVSRFREELTRQDTTADAVAATVATAGRTIAVSGITVAVALASLMLFPETFLRSMGFGGVATVLVDMLAALTVLPALLAVLGPRVNALQVRLPWVRRHAQRPVPAGERRVEQNRDEQSGGWYRIAGSVMRRPVAYVVVILLVLLALASPFRSITWGGTDARALPAGAPARVVAEALNRDFPGNPSSPVEVVTRLPGPAAAPAQQTALAAYVHRLARVPRGSSAALTGVRGDIARVDLRYTADPYSATARDIVTGVRAVPPPAGGHAYVGGVTAQLVDELSSL